MTDLRIRPRFERRSELRAAYAIAQLRDALAASGAPVQGLYNDGRFELMTAGDDHHFWSPELRFRVEDDGQGSLIIGRFGPKPPVWVMFTIIYIHLIFVGLAGLMYGSSQWMAGGSLWPLWGVPISLVAGVIVYAAARLGQRLGTDEMRAIATFVERAVERQPSG